MGQGGPWRGFHGRVARGVQGRGLRGCAGLKWELAPGRGTARHSKERAKAKTKQGPCHANSGNSRKASVAASVEFFNARKVVENQGLGRKLAPERGV